MALLVPRDAAAWFLLILIAVAASALPQSPSVSLTTTGLYSWTEYYTDLLSQHTIPIRNVATMPPAFASPEEVLSTAGSDASPTPFVIMHGVSASNDSVEHPVLVMQSLFPGIYTRAVEIGNGNWDSIFWGMNKQVDAFCEAIQGDSRLQGGFNLMGNSQGGLIARGYLERCNAPPVRTFVSWVSPQGGQFGVPELGNSTLQKFLEDTFDCCVYDKVVQETFSFAGYWIDPWKYDEFVKYSEFLADVDNLRANNTNYKHNVLSVQYFLMSYSEVDTTLIPKETGWFGFFAQNTISTIVPLEQTSLWQQDLIGLRTLSDQQKLIRFTTQCEHGDYDSSCFDHYFTTYVVPYLK